MSSVPPEISIIIPVYGQWELTRKCLDSVARHSHGCRHSIEVLLADDASPEPAPPDLTRDWRGTGAYHYFRNETNHGFIGNCNAAAARAVGQHFCFLNSDTEVESGWLDLLLDTLTRHPQAAMVGPVTISPSGLILECGNILYQDAGSCPLGQGLPPSDARFCHVNEVDYVSGACLLIAAEKFHEVGGFDVEFSPAYYEEVDLCMKWAQRGFRVLVDPSVQVRHISGASHAAGHSSRLCEINRRKFYARWRERLLAMHPDRTVPREHLRAWRRGPTIIVHDLEQMECRGARALRNLRLLKTLHAAGHHVVWICHAHGSIQMLEEMRSLGIECCPCAPGAEEKIRMLLAECSPAAVIFTSAAQECAYGAFYRTKSPQTLRILDISPQAADTGDAVSTKWTDDVYQLLLGLARCDAVLVPDSSSAGDLTAAFHYPRDRIGVLAGEGAGPEWEPYFQRVREIRHDGGVWNITGELVWRSCPQGGRPGRKKSKLPGPVLFIRRHLRNAWRALLPTSRP